MGGKALWRLAFHYFRLLFILFVILRGHLRDELEDGRLYMGEEITPSGDLKKANRSQSSVCLMLVPAWPSFSLSGTCFV